MNLLWKKTVVIGILALLFGMTLAPNMTATTDQEVANAQNTDDNIIKSTEENNQEESFRTNLQSLISEINLRKDRFDGLKDLINWILNKSDYPLLASLFSRLMNTERLQGRDIIISAGWNYNMNPLKKTEFKVIKPIAVWKLRENSEMMKMPSTTILISSDPVKIETVMGNQLGFMFRFRGVYGYFPQQFPKQSFAYMIGTAKNAAAFELPSMNLFAS